MRARLLLVPLLFSCAEPAPPATAGPPSPDALAQRLVALATPKAVTPAAAASVVERLQALRRVKDARRAGEADEAAVTAAQEALEQSCREASGLSCEALLYRPAGGAR
jgi:hypothetical protein